MDVAQPVSIRNQGEYFASVHEDEFDRLVMIDQQQQDELNRSIKLEETLNPALFDTTIPAPAAGKVLTGTASGFDWTTLDSSAVSLPGGGRTVTTLSGYLANNARFNAKDYGAIADATSRPLSGFFGTLAAAQVVYPAATALTQELDWAASQKCVNAAAAVHGKAWHPTGTYEFGATGWTIPQGTQLEGDTGFQFIAGFAINPNATRINFNPATTKDLFTVAADGVSGFHFHMSVQGFYFHGNSVKGGATTSRYGLRLDAVIYARFENIGIEGFQTPVYCSSTINNKFTNVYCSGTVAAVVYAGQNETTDSWEHCTFYGPNTGVGCPIGVQFLGSSIAIRFEHCLFEQIDNYGAEIAKDCQNITFVDCYCEDVPFTNNAAAAMFRVGYTGTALVVENHLTVIGGKYAGRNAGAVGQFLDCDSSNGVMLIGVNHSRFTNIIRTTGNTRANSIVVMGGVGISWTTYATDFTKIAGIYPNGVVNTGNNHQDARFGSLGAASAAIAGALSAGTASIASAVAGLLTLYNSAAAAANLENAIKFQHLYTNFGQSDSARVVAKTEEALNPRASLVFETADGSGNPPTVKAKIRGAGQLELTNIGATPANLVDGQIWWDGTNFRTRQGGATKTITVT
jgi:hypothetical protein